MNLNIKNLRVFSDTYTCNPSLCNVDIYQRLVYLSLNPLHCPSFQSPQLPSLLKHSKENWQSRTAALQVSAVNTLFLHSSVILNEDSSVVGGVKRRSLAPFPGNIWNRSAGWPGLVLPRLTATQTLMLAHTQPQRQGSYLS